MLFFVIICVLAYTRLDSGGNGAKIKTKDAPSYTGVDLGLQPYVADYIQLAAKHNVKFTEPQPVTMGFTHILSDSVIGYCTYGKNFREIDIDIVFWEKASPTTKMLLIFHEMTHCLCTRDHDYGNGEKYQPAIIEYLIGRGIPFYKDRPGYYQDGCPTSIMHPIILSDSCYNAHSKDYMGELFNRCSAY